LADGNSSNSTTFSGSFEAIPEPKYTAIILGGVFLLFVLAARFKREKRAMLPVEKVPASA
jgi:hypothetical protein